MRHSRLRAVGVDRAVTELASALVRNHGPSLFDIRNAKRNIRTAH